MVIQRYIRGEKVQAVAFRPCWIHYDTRGLWETIAKSKRVRRLSVKLLHCLETFTCLLCPHSFYCAGCLLLCFFHICCLCFLFVCLFVCLCVCLCVGVTRPFSWWTTEVRASKYGSKWRGCLSAWTPTRPHHHLHQPAPLLALPLPLPLPPPFFTFPSSSLSVSLFVRLFPCLVVFFVGDMKLPVSALFVC